MNRPTRLSLKDTYQLLAGLPLMEKDDQELNELVEQILDIQDSEEVRQLLQQHLPD